MRSSLNIFWDILLCHLQNEANITDYIIQYNRTFGGEARNISSSDSGVTCGEVSGYRYRCLIIDTLFITGSLYTFKVSAINRYGLGPFSDPIITEVDVQSISVAKLMLTLNYQHCTSCLLLYYYFFLGEICISSNIYNELEARPHDVRNIKCLHLHN